MSMTHRQSCHSLLFKPMASDGQDDPFEPKPPVLRDPAEATDYFVLHAGLDGGQSGPRGIAADFFHRGGSIQLPECAPIVFHAVHNETGDVPQRNYLRIQTEPHTSECDVVRAFQILHYWIGQAMYQRFITLHKGLFGDCIWAPNQWRTGQAPKTSQDLCAFSSGDHPTAGSCAFCAQVPLTLNAV